MKQTVCAVLAASLIFTACGTRHATSTTMTTNGSTTTTTTTSHTAFAVPVTVQFTFTTQYPGASAVTWVPYDQAAVPIDWDLTDWTMLTPKDYQVNYTLNGNQYYSWYDANGNWIGTSYYITDYHNGLPAPVNATIATKYPGYSIDKASLISWKDRTAYDLKLKNGDNKMRVLIDTNGDVLKQKDK